ncbi:hypothetical protein J5X84_17180 [Streptosporangiaceae bacterium NEAU-GS5]|nr:hypothetical protein [Streptosporangiaceae bacterium NEAU-GS5]
MGWLLCLIGIAGVFYEGDPSNFGAVAGQSWQVLLFAAGLTILLLQRSDLAYGAGLAVGGGYLYYTIATSSGSSWWTLHGGAIAIAMVICGIALSSDRLVINDAAVNVITFLAAAIWAALWATRYSALADDGVRELVARYQEYLPQAREYAAGAASVLLTVWVLKTVRSDDPVVRGRLLTAVGLTLVVTEWTLSWSLPSWRSAVLIIGAMLAISGLVVDIAAGFRQERYMPAAGVAVLLGIGGRVALGAWQDRLHLTSPHLKAADLFMLGMVAVALTAVTAHVVSEQAKASPEFADARSLFVDSAIVSWAAVAMVVLGLAAIGKFQLPSEVSGALTLLAVVACLLFFLSAWSVILLIADTSFRQAMDGWPNITALWYDAVVRGPRDVGDGPFLTLAGIALFAALSILLEPDAFPELRLAGAILIVTGLTRISATVMRRIHDASEESPESHVSPLRHDDLAVQTYLIPKAVAAGGTAATLMFLVTSGIWLPLRFVFALLASAGFAIFSAPILYALAVPALRRLNITWEDLVDWLRNRVEGRDIIEALQRTGDAAETARVYAVGAAAGLILGVTSIVFAAGFELYLLLEILLVLLAVSAVATTVTCGLLMIETVNSAERSDFLARTRGLATNKRPTFRLLPEPEEVGAGS